VALIAWPNQLTRRAPGGGPAEPAPTAAVAPAGR
jgi:hypothetical protein